ncbi:MAG: hypothetical protein AAF611_21715 [Bacteroidota bacterium]
MKCTTNFIQMIAMTIRFFQPFSGNQQSFAPSEPIPLLLHH